MDDDQDRVVDPNGPPPWIHLLSPQQRDWRARQHMMGRNPDSYILEQLDDAGAWPPRTKHRTRRKPAAPGRSVG
ncbi:hypothetical protein [Methylobacterium mesophilicum]|uniref:hypothetical protein n=1 Tax=Methylobacterium mesophilicum TaxID=39956 RepID=UPI001EE1B54F|nr:hypothetical protein [Methylobacterium mesophilicum]